jgi:hypothetical protein
MERARERDRAYPPSGQPAGAPGPKVHSVHVPLMQCRTPGEAHGHARSCSDAVAAWYFATPSLLIVAVEQPQLPVQRVPLAINTQSGSPAHERSYAMGSIVTQAAPSVSLTESASLTELASLASPPAASVAVAASELAPPSSLLAADPPHATTTIAQAARTAKARTK